ncbi:MAG: ATP-binding cassette domain-containing protein [Clostridia bacterium]|nr:ATP-binding cassette domain-containing protein [Clostridia bacterium]
MIEIQNISKKYGDKYAVKDATFTIKKGEILGFLGRNGAGKSTTMNIVTGYISATSGKVTVNGHDILEDPREAKRCIGYLPELPPLYMDMTVDEYLRFVCAIKDVKKSYVKTHLDDITELVRITDVRKRLIKNLSKGYKQRVGIAQALIGNPEVVILDEPTVGLDPRQIIEIRKLIKELGEDHTVVLSSHILHEVADVCERVVIINQGSIVAQDTLDNLTKNISETSRFRLRVAGPEREVQKLIRDVPGTRTVDQMGVKEADTFDFLVEADRNTDIRRPLFQSLAKAGYPMLMLRPMDIELEDIFLQLTNERGEE